MYVLYFISATTVDDIYSERLLIIIIIFSFCSGRRQHGVWAADSTVCGVVLYVCSYLDLNYGEGDSLFRGTALFPMPRHLPPQSPPSSLDWVQTTQASGRHEWMGNSMSELKLGLKASHEAIMLGCCHAHMLWWWRLRKKKLEHELGQPLWLLWLLATNTNWAGAADF